MFLALLLLVPAFGYGQQAKLSGKVRLDTGWARKFYVCRMPGFDYMFTTSNALIIAEGDIDTAGNFSVNFPATTRLLEKKRLAWLSPYCGAFPG